MSLFELLQSLGGRLGILEMSHGQLPQVPARIQTRSVTLAELCTEVRAEEVRALADQPAELSIPFAQIFETAGVKAEPHGWTIERLIEMLRSVDFKNQPKESVQKKVLEVLHSENVATEVIVKDAMARDRVLDSFEVHVRKKMEDRRAALERRAAEIEETLKNLQEERSELDRKKKTDEEKWAEWRRQKKAHEQDMASALSHIIDKSIISISDE